MDNHIAFALAGADIDGFGNPSCDLGAGHQRADYDVLTIKHGAHTPLTRIINGDGFTEFDSWDKWAIEALKIEVKRYISERGLKLEMVDAPQTREISGDFKQPGVDSWDRDDVALNIYFKRDKGVHPDDSIRRLAGLVEALSEMQAEAGKITAGIMMAHDGAATDRRGGPGGR